MFLLFPMWIVCWQVFLLQCLAESSGAINKHSIRRKDGHRGDNNQLLSSVLSVFVTPWICDQSYDEDNDDVEWVQRVQRPESKFSQFKLQDSKARVRANHFVTKVKVSTEYVMEGTRYRYFERNLEDICDIRSRPTNWGLPLSTWQRTVYKLDGGWFVCQPILLNTLLVKKCWLGTWCRWMILLY